MKRIFLLEDDPLITKGLRFTLQSEGFALTSCAALRQAREAVFAEPFDLAVVDLTLPDGCGTQLVQLIKERLPELPVLILTARDDENDVVRGFDLGADDYVTKPFGSRELVSRIKNLLRRYKKDETVLAAGDITADLSAERVYRNGAEVKLSALEYRLLILLLQNKGHTVPRERILDRIWDLAGNYVNDNTLTVYIKRIREKLGEDAIVTVKGIGYRVD
ncbi:MAG: response regulator transcription factor [Clostridia bacterium]|nr:response regulator transcription factor [Clostridia bacterium]